MTVWPSPSTGIRIHLERWNMQDSQYGNINAWKIVKIFPSKRCMILNKACGGRVLGHTQILHCTLKNENTLICSVYGGTRDLGHSNLTEAEVWLYWQCHFPCRQPANAAQKQSWAWWKDFLCQRQTHVCHSFSRFLLSGCAWSQRWRPFHASGACSDVRLVEIRKPWQHNTDVNLCPRPSGDTSKPKAFWALIYPPVTIYRQISQHPAAWGPPRSSLLPPLSLSKWGESLPTPLRLLQFPVEAQRTWIIVRSLRGGATKSGMDPGRAWWWNSPTHPSDPWRGL